MGRPKASQRVKSIALEFVKIVSQDLKNGDHAISVTSRFGRKSLHSALMHCLPKLTRCESVVENRQGISEMELNKLLRAQGHGMVKRNNFLLDGETSRREWSDLRWVDPKIDLSHIKSTLAELCKNFPEATCCSLDAIVTFLNVAHSDIPSKRSGRKLVKPSTHIECISPTLSDSSSTSSKIHTDSDKDDSALGAHAFSRAVTAESAQALPPRKRSLSIGEGDGYHHYQQSQASLHHHSASPQRTQPTAEFASAAKRSCQRAHCDGADAPAGAQPIPSNLFALAPLSLPPTPPLLPSLSYLSQCDGAGGGGGSRRLSRDEGKAAAGLAELQLLARCASLLQCLPPSPPASVKPMQFLPPTPGGMCAAGGGGGHSQSMMLPPLRQALGAAGGSFY